MNRAKKELKDVKNINKALREQIKIVKRLNSIYKKLAVSQSGLTEYISEEQPVMNNSMQPMFLDEDDDNLDDEDDTIDFFNKYGPLNVKSLLQIDNLIALSANTLLNRERIYL